MLLMNAATPQDLLVLDDPAIPTDIVITKSITLEPRSGNPAPAYATLHNTSINALGLGNKGVAHFLQEILPNIRNKPVYVNVAGENVKEYSALTRLLSSAPVAGIEVNLSCPNTSSRIIAYDPSSCYDICTAIRAATTLPLIVKLPPYLDTYLLDEIIDVVEDTHMDGITACNTAGNAHLLGITGGMGGVAVRPLALGTLRYLQQHTTLPLWGAGGIETEKDVEAYKQCGVSGIQIGTAALTQGTGIYTKLRRYCN